MSDFLSRLQVEASELGDKKDKLLNFLQEGNTDKLSNKQLDLLTEQWEAMSWYHHILTTRILDIKPLKGNK